MHPGPPGSVGAALYKRYNQAHTSTQLNKALGVAPWTPFVQMGEKKSSDSKRKNHIKLNITQSLKRQLEQKTRLIEITSF